MVELDADRALALAYVPAARREAVAALWQLDLAMGAVLAGGREPLISQIKLAWWRDSLDKLDREDAPAEPVLQALSKHVLPLGVAGSELAEMEEGWSVLLSQEPLSEAELATYAAKRGALLFRFVARALGGDLAEHHSKSGEAWALMDLARHSNPVDAKAAAEAAAVRLQAGATRWPSRLRPLGMLAALAERDLRREGAPEPQGSPGRMLRMLGHRLTGR